MSLPIRLFVSSPSDVAAERQAVERVARRLEGLFDGVKFEVYRWEKDRYYSAHVGFQEQIAEIGGFDLVVGVLWARIGSPLPPGFAARMPHPREGQPYPSGTAFELLEAIRLRRTRQSPPPDILVYRKTAPPPAAPADDDAAQERLLHEMQALNRFMADFFANAADGFKAAFKTFVSLDAFESALQEDLAAWLAANHRLAAPRPWRIEERGAPFVGLNAFDIDHRDVFFGRRAEVERARERLEAGGNFLLVEGASGTGKSSLARAGLVPRLMDLDPTLRVAVTIPETDGPLAALATALFATGALPELAEGDFPTASQLTGHLLTGGEIAPILRALDRAARRLQALEGLEKPPDLRLLLLVDQLESLFAGRVPLPERAAYADLLQRLVASGRVLVVATLRANAREEALAVPALGRLIDGRQGLSLEPATADALGEIVRAPALAAGIAHERDAEGLGLDEVLLAEVSRDTASLPLLQFALERLYLAALARLKAEGRRPGETPDGSPVLILTHSDHRAFGGLAGAIGHQAEEALGALPASAADRLPALVRALTETGAGAVVLKSAAIATAAPDPETGALVDALVRARILVQGVITETEGPAVPAVRFSHERVLTAWSRARAAVEAAAGYLRVRGDLVRAEARWRQEGRRSDLLLAPGLPLAEAQKALDDFGPELDRQDPRLRAYVAASARRARLRQGFATAAAAVFLVLAVAAGWFALDARQQRDAAERAGALAQEEARTAQRNRSNALVALALSRAQTDPHEAIRLVLAAWPRTHDDPFPETALAYRALSEAIAATRPQQVIAGHEGPVNATAFFPDGRQFLSAGEDGTLRLWDVAIGLPVGEALRGHEGGVYAVAVSPDGARIVSGGADGTLRLWDVAKGDQLGEPWRGHDGGPGIVAFSPDGSRVVSGGEDRTVRTWDSATARQLAAHDLGDFGAVYDLAFSPDEQRVIVGGLGGFVSLTLAADATSVETLLRNTGVVTSVALSRTGIESSPEILQVGCAFGMQR